MNRFDVVVFGNGVIGSAIAFRLKRKNPDLKLAIVGPRSRTGAASLAAGAMLGCFAEVTKYTFKDAASKAKFALSWTAEQKWPAWLREISAVSGLKLPIVPGTYVINNTVSGELDDENFDAIIKALKRYKQPYKQVQPSSIKGLCPIPNHRPLRAIFIPGEHAIDSHKLMDAMDAANKKLGVEFVDDELAAVQVNRVGIQSARLTSGTNIESNLYISALGSFTQALLDQLPSPHATIPSLAGVGVAFTAKRVLGQGFDHVVRTPNRSGSCGLHVVPLGNDSEYVGATNVVFRQPDFTSNIGMSHYLMQYALEQLDTNLFFSQVINWRVGNRPITLDGYPAIGWSQVPNLYLVYGTYRDGLHCSPEIADKVAAAVAGKKRGPNDIFSPLRPPVLFGTREASIKEFAYQAVCDALENGLALPVHTDIGQLETSFKDIAHKVYTGLAVDYSFSPDLLHYIAFGQRSPEDTQRIKDYFKSRLKSSAGR